MSKEETIKTLKKLKSFHNGSYGTAIDEAIKALEQQPKSGKWIVIRKEYEFMGSIVNEAQGCKCSNCDGIVKLKSDFCPNCGADMMG